MTATIRDLSIPRHLAEGVSEIHVCLAFGERDESGQTLTGNPAAVALLDHQLSRSQRKRLASTIGMPMAAFVVPTNDRSKFDVSFFSASGDEFQICGHAAMATSKILSDEMGIAKAELRLAEPFPDLTSIVTNCSTNTSQVTIALPTAASTRLMDRQIRNVIVEMAKIDLDSIDEVLATETGDLLVILSSQSVLQAIDLNLGRAAAWTTELDYRGILFTSLTDRPGYDIETRAFFPAHGIGEDIACGSANCAIVPYWLDRVRSPKTTLRVCYPIGRGANSTVGGEMDAVLDLTDGTVVLTGAAVRSGIV